MKKAFLYAICLFTLFTVTNPIQSEQPTESADQGRIHIVMTRLP